MTRSDLIEQLAHQHPLLSHDEVAVIVKTIFDVVEEALQKGDKVEIRGFGSFHLRHRHERTGRNPRTGAKVFVPEKRVPFFKAGKELRRLADHQTS